MFHQIPLEEALTEEQLYIIDIALKKGYDIKAMRFDAPSVTCFDKAKLLNWPAERVVKSIFRDIDQTRSYMLPGAKGRTKEKSTNWYAFVSPELGKYGPENGIINPFDFTNERVQKILQSTANIDIREQYAVGGSRSHIPKMGMGKGTCTPLVPDTFFNEEYMMLSDGYTGVLEKIFIYHSEEFKDKIVDISIGGTDQLSWMTSLHLPYQAIEDILIEKFGKENIIPYTINL